MFRDGITIKGNKEGLNVIININSFKDFDEMLDAFIAKLSKGKRFYKGCTLRITTQLKEINERNTRKLKDILFDEFLIKDCIFEDSDENKSKVFSGIYEGRTKFLRRTVRSGQIIKYSGNVVIVGDVNPGSEIYAGGNVIVFGILRGDVHAGSTGNDKAIIAALRLQPKILQIANRISRAPEDDDKPDYPEVARLKGDAIIVEPYSPNKFNI
ncbi:septum site-determining protein MinC [Clostridium acetobutylicum]|uniref:Probable septum site-determining protein MinC n=1 Tax=Clostridium acetobutylicum (strain ATCC 824 / DSM 792 / JCM 1419 / IAM 19013 / LMG 5710 / NBRC 13948 / NRRL B-527 / VKM B-1787 / 2291 / W) TaxID=272562 RepID=MINC_CLOAB|nr:MULTISPECIES: septum site-determining protein MinC [Clostridium]Q97JM5.1 RecName: Full=Probable septum site-determining protein MinC [Clostridium acetobutylicum ATCC 824]AAK79220.1 Septum site-determining protein MinC [Clostridium acetobutylicum ATCC 824]ADZ20299.1 septum formation inhibitor [Clostridium acetobutylicum EA 2018]AEI33233.1 septum formation inhibitor [Clostridium acetobutylicum DSM 1731]AWV81531.1 septum site-determining protein MinC [Clostridium acetobutylicum]KHD35121.1 sep